MCKNWALWSAGMSNGVMEKAATSLLLLDNLLAQNILIASLFFFLVLFVEAFCTPLWHSTCKEWNFTVSTQWNYNKWRIRISEYGNVNTWASVWWKQRCYHQILSSLFQDGIGAWCFRMADWLMFNHVFKYYPRFWHSLFHKCFWLRNDLCLYIHDLIFSITHHALKEMQFPFEGCPLGDLSF